MTPRRDWFSFADPHDVMAEYLAGPQDMDEIQPGVWGHKGIAVICVGDVAHMRKIAAKMFHDRFHGKPCSMGYYGPDHGGPPLPCVYDRMMEALK